MMTSDDIARMASQQMSLFEQSRSFAGSIGQTAGAVPMPSAELTPAFSSGGAGLMAAQGAVGLAQGAVGAASLVGAAGGFGLGGAAGRALSLMDPFSGAQMAASTGWSAGGGAAAFARGSAAPVARALGAGSVALGGYMAAGSLFSAMTEQVMRGAQEQMAANEMLKRNVSMRSMPGMSFDSGTLGSMASAVRQASSTSTPFDTVNSTVAAGMQAGLYQNVSTLQQFTTQTQALTRAAQQYTNAGFGAETLFQDTLHAQRMGFYGAAGMGAGMGARVLGESMGIGGGLLQAGGFGAQAAQGFGSRRRGAGVAMGLAQRLASGYRSGALDADQMQDLMGGQGLEEGVGSLAGSLTQAAYSEASDTTTLMGLIDPETGHISSDLASSFAGGMMSRTELQRRARKNRGNRSARMAVQARRGSLAGELVGMGAPEEILAGMARADMVSRGVRPGESAEDVMSLSLQKFGSMGEDQARLVQDLISAGPGIKNDIANRMQDIIRTQNSGRSGAFSIDTIKKKLVDRYVEPIAAPLRELGASIASWGSGLADSAVAAIVGTQNAPLGAASVGGGEMLTSAMRGGAAGQGLLRGMGGAMTGRVGMQFGGQNLLFNNDASNFGTVGLYDSLPNGTVAGGLAAGNLVGGLAASGLLSAGSSLLGGAAARFAGAPSTLALSGGLEAAKQVGGAAARGVGGLGLGLAGSMARMVFNPFSLGVSALAAGGGFGDYYGSYDNRGAVPAAVADAFEGMGGGAVVRGGRRGYYGVEQDSIGWAGGIGVWADRMGDAFGAVDDVGPRRSVSARELADIPELLRARMSPTGYMSQLGGESDVLRMRGTYDGPAGAALRRQATLGASSSEMMGTLRSSMYAQYGSAGSLYDITGDARQLAALHAISGGEIGGSMIDQISASLSASDGSTDTANGLGGLMTGVARQRASNIAGRRPLPQMLGQRGGGGIFDIASDTMRLTADALAVATTGIGGSGMPSKDELLKTTKAAGSTFERLLSKGGRDAQPLLDFMEAKDAQSRKATYGKLHGLRNRLTGDEYGTISDLTTGLGDDKYEGLQASLRSIQYDVMRPNQQAALDRQADYESHVGRFGKGTADAARMAKALGSQDKNRLLDLAGKNVTSRGQALQGIDFFGGYGSSMEDLTEYVAGMDGAKRSYAMSMLNEEQQAAGAKGSVLYDSMMYKGRSKGRGVVSALSMLEGSELVDKDFSRQISRAIDSGRGLTSAQNAEVERLLGISGLSADSISKAKSALDRVSHAKSKSERAAGAADFAGAVGSADGVKFKDTGQKAQSSDMSQAISAFSSAVKEAASVISSAAQGKNMSGPA